MQVTAAFTRKSYLHLISLIILLLISISTWNLSQNLSLDLFHHNNKRITVYGIASAFNDFPGRSVFVLKIYFRLEFWYVYSFKRKSKLYNLKRLIFINNANIVEIIEINQQRRYSIISVAYLHFWFPVKRKKVVSAQIRLSCLHASNSCFRKTVISASN